jgi:hypothetical protein
MGGQAGCVKGCSFVRLKRPVPPPRPEASPPPRAAAVKDLPRSGAAQAASLTAASTAAGSDKEGNYECRMKLMVATRMPGH